MQFSEAGVADVLRCQQQDENFVRKMQNDIQTIVKLFGGKNYLTTQRTIPALTNAWYYGLTTLGNLQTLGEEYSGTLRFNRQNNVPTTTLEIMWLLLYIGGEPLYEKLVYSMQEKIKQSKELADNAKTVFLKILVFLQQHKLTIKRIHHALFYINGKYYNFSNRITGIKYVLVREWLRDDTFTKSFRFLGNLSLFYILTTLIQQVFSSKSSGIISEEVCSTTELIRKGCVLCGESRKNPCAVSCGHIFCWDCIYDSLSYQHSCPICREVVLPSRVILLQNYV